MLYEVSRDITRVLVENEIIEFDSFPSYQYGVEMLLVTIAELLGAIAIAITLHLLPEFVVFILAFSSLRFVAGGYHAKTVFRCFASFIVITLLSVYFVSIFGHMTNAGLNVIVAGIANLIFLWKAPVAVPNRPVTDEERKRFRKLTLSISFFYLILILLSTHFQYFTWLAGIFSYGMLFEAISLVVEDYREDFQNEASYIEDC